MKNRVFGSATIIVIYLFFAFLFDVLPVSVWADWQYTRWGMTSAEVIAASGGAAEPTVQDERVRHRLTTENIEPLLKAVWTSGRFRFIAFFYFGRGANSLSLVTLKLENPEFAHELIGALRSRYGEPEIKSQSSVIETMVWRTAADQINFVKIGERSVSVQYKPRHSEDTKGL